MNNVNETVARNLRDLRKSLHLTQSNLADLIGYSVKTVSKWESGGSIPPSAILPELAMALKTDINCLFREVEQPMYYLGIDGGGTKTDFVLANKEGKLLKRVTLNSANPFDVGEENAFRVLRDGIYQVCSEIPFSQISVYAGVAGGGAGDYPQKIEEFLKGFRFARARNGNDVSECITLGLGDRDGIVVILGTGSIAYTQYQGTVGKTGGFGYMLGDEGGGYAIGRDMLRAVLEAEEGYGEKTMLLDSVRKACGTKTVAENISRFYQGGKKQIASYAPLVFEAWQAGDAVGRRILEDNMRAVAEMILHAGSRFPSGAQVPVVLFGSITKDEAVILPLINAHLAAESKAGPTYHLSVCAEPVYMGALLLAGLPVIEGDKHA
ncbi:MAG: XRE family transcriptional regulator [Clostridia bacterium]|nr:XRE family transcriptional regulator [Clostridia bacterium]